MQVGIPSNRWRSGDNPGPRPGTSPQEEDSTVAPMPSIPMYLAGLLVTGTGLHAANLSLGDTSFAALVLGLTLIGFAASYITRRQNIAPRNVELPALIVCVCVVLMAVISDPADSFLAPASVAEDRSKALALLLTWLTVFRSFTLTSDASLLFCCVPTIALIGLVGTSTSDPLLSTIFLVFVAAAVFMMVHENVRQTTFRQRDRRPSKPAGRSAAGWGGQVQATAVCTILALIIANVTTPFFQAAGSFVRVSSGLSTIKMAQERATVSRNANDDRTELRVGAGPVSLTDDIIFTVHSPEPVNWRGTTYDRYDGRGWVNTHSGTMVQLMEATDSPSEAQKPDQKTYVVQPSAITQRARRFHVLDQHFHFVQGSTTNIYGAAEVRRISLPERRIAADDTGSIRLADPLTNAEYDVRSEVAEWLPSAQREAPGNYSREIERYTQLPSVRSVREAMDKVRQQALEVTSGKSSTMDKVEALEQWIGGQCKYNTNTPQFPADQEAVSYFLFEAKQGYCDSFATSLAIMCRTLDIPARVVSGYLSGDMDNSAGQYVVRDRHRHLWTEVYFNGVGWMPFDATSFAEDVSPARANQKSKAGSFWAGLMSYGWWPPALLAVVLALLVYVFKVEVLDRFWRHRGAAPSLGLPETNQAVVMEYENACRVLARRGLRRFTSETAEEYLSRVLRSEVTPQVSGPLSELTDLVTRYRYSAAIARDSDISLARVAAARLAQGLRAMPRRLPVIPAAVPESA